MSTTSIVDPQALAGLRELNPDDPAFLRELIDLFIKDVGERVAEIERALATADANLLTRAAHTIKGSCSNFGAAGLVAASQAMELQGKTGDLAGAASMLPALKAERAAVSEALQAYR
jgi:HPt (histidine-containing phosphotransfer) domain-containing protein